MTDMITQLTDINQIKDLVHGFSNRDQGKWAELRALFADDATVAISWFNGPALAFVDACARGYENAPPKTSVKHLLGFPRIRVSGDRAYADTDATILMRVPFGEKRIMLDVTSWCRFCHMCSSRRCARSVIPFDAKFARHGLLDLPRYQASHHQTLREDQATDNSIPALAISQARRQKLNP